VVSNDAGTYASAQRRREREAVTSTREAFVGPRIVADHEVLDDHAVVVCDGMIEGLIPVNQLPSDMAVLDLGPGILTPGLVDIHSHGAAGHAFNEGTPTGNERALKGLLAAGVTTVLPTLASAPLDDLVACLASLDSPGGGDRPRTPGVHLEGPYFSNAQSGAQDPAALLTPDDGSIDRLMEHRSTIRMMSYAPELPGAIDLTTRLVAEGIVAAAGHSDGRDTDLLACQREGLSHVIHVFSGQSSTIRQGPWRRPGMLEGTLASDGLTVEMIGDGKHLPATLMQMAYRCLGDRLCLVSDSTPGAGMPRGSSYRMGDMEYTVDDGVGVTLDGLAFGGSTTFISEMIPRTMAAIGLGLAEAVAMATSVPARAAKLPLVGRIKFGFHADFALFNSRMELQRVAIAGHWK
jgi:N-acetylglucosamine-6-phosphate deacetylase